MRTRCHWTHCQTHKAKRGKIPLRAYDTTRLTNKFNILFEFPEDIEAGWSTLPISCLGICRRNHWAKIELPSTTTSCTTGWDPYSEPPELPPVATTHKYRIRHNKTYMYGMLCASIDETLGSTTLARTLPLGSELSSLIFVEWTRIRICLDSAQFWYHRWRTNPQIGHLCYQKNYKMILPQTQTVYPLNYRSEPWILWATHFMHYPCRFEDQTTSPPNGGAASSFLYTNGQTQKRPAATSADNPAVGSNKGLCPPYRVAQPLLLKTRRPQQSGFSHGRSTIYATLALKIFFELHREFDHSLNAAFLDIKSAFDSADCSTSQGHTRYSSMPDRRSAPEHWSMGASRQKALRQVKVDLWRATGLHTSFIPALDWILNHMTSKPSIEADPYRFPDFVLNDDTSLFLFQKMTYAYKAPWQTSIKSQHLSA